MQSFVQYRKNQLQNQLYRLTVKEAVDRYFDILKLEVFSTMKLPMLLTEGNFVAKAAYERACREDYEDNKQVIEFIINTYKKNLYNQIISEAADSTAKTLDDLKKDIEIEVKDLVGKLRTDVLKVITASRPPRADSQKFGGTPSGGSGSGTPSGGSGTPSGGSGTPSGGSGTPSGGTGAPSGGSGTPSGGTGAPSGGTDSVIPSGDSKRPKYGTERPELPRDSKTYKPSPYGWMKPHDSWLGGIKRAIWDPIAGWVAKKTQPFRRRWHDDPMREHSVFLERTFLASFEKLDRLLADFESKVLNVFVTRVPQIAKAVGGKIEVAPTSDLASKKDIVGNDNQTDTIPVTGRPQEKQDSKDDKEYTVDDVLKYKDLDGQEKQDLTPKEETEIAQFNLQKVVKVADEFGYKINTKNLKQASTTQLDRDRFTKKIEGQEQGQPILSFDALFEDLVEKISNIVIPEKIKKIKLPQKRYEAIYKKFGEKFGLHKGGRPKKVFGLLRDFYDYRQMATPAEPTVSAPESGKTFVAQPTSDTSQDSDSKVGNKPQSSPDIMGSKPTISASAKESAEPSKDEIAAELKKFGFDQALIDVVFELNLSNSEIKNEINKAKKGGLSGDNLIDAISELTKKNNQLGNNEFQPEKETEPTKQKPKENDNILAKEFVHAEGKFILKNLLNSYQSLKKKQLGETIAKELKLKKQTEILDKAKKDGIINDDGTINDEKMAELLAAFNREIKSLKIDVKEDKPQGEKKEIDEDDKKLAETLWSDTEDMEPYLANIEKFSSMYIAKADLDEKNKDKTTRPQEENFLINLGLKNDSPSQDLEDPNAWVWGFEEIDVQEAYDKFLQNAILDEVAKVLGQSKGTDKDQRDQIGKEKIQNIFQILDNQTKNNTLLYQFNLSDKNIPAMAPAQSDEESPKAQSDEEPPKAQSDEEPPKAQSDEEPKTYEQFMEEIDLMLQQDTDLIKKPKTRQRFYEAIKDNEDIRTQFNALMSEKPNLYDNLKQKITGKIKLMIIDKELDEEEIVKTIQDIRSGISESFYERLRKFKKTLRS